MINFIFEVYIIYFRLKKDNTISLLRKTYARNRTHFEWSWSCSGHAIKEQQALPQPETIKTSMYLTAESANAVNSLIKAAS